jgi:hypothetical protein
MYRTQGMGASGVYALPVVGRAGLGNALLPWARAELFADRVGARLLAPKWNVIRPGPYLRGEPDKRSYGDCFLEGTYTAGFRRSLVLALGRRVDEATFEAAANCAPFDRSCVVEFCGIGDLFTPLVQSAPLIRHRLWQMTRAVMRPQPLERDDRFIAMHVRRGDITRQGFSATQLATVNQYTPLSWFIGMHGLMQRDPTLRHFPISLFTDGSADEVAELARLKGVHLNKRQSAIADLWTLSQASLLIASGYSTFSMWASFLGGMPTVYAPGKMQQRLQSGSAVFEGEVTADGPLPPGIVAHLAPR